MPNGILIDTVEEFEKQPDSEKLNQLFRWQLENFKRCQCRLKQCEKQFVKKMVIKGKYLPISKFTFFAGGSVVIFLTGAGLIRPEQFIKWVKFILPFI